MQRVAPMLWQITQVASSRQRRPKPERGQQKEGYSFLQRFGCVSYVTMFQRLEDASIVAWKEDMVANALLWIHQYICVIICALKNYQYNNFICILLDP